MQYRTTTVAVFTAVLLAGLSAGLLAHLTVSRTLPADGAELTEAPTSIQVWFSQQPSVRVSRLELRGPQGTVATGDIEFHPEERSMRAEIKEALAPGTYEVHWRTAGDDGHVMRGVFTFTLRHDGPGDSDR